MNRNLSEICNKIDEELNMPNEQDNIEVERLYKKGCRKKMSNKRGPSFTDNAINVYEKVIKERNNPWITSLLKEYQNGQQER